MRLVVLNEKSTSAVKLVLSNLIFSSFPIGYLGFNY